MFYKKNYNDKFENLTDIYNIINDYSKGYLTENFNAHPNEYFQQIYSFLYTAAERDGNNEEHKKFKDYFEQNTFDTIENAQEFLSRIGFRGARGCLMQAHSYNVQTSPYHSSAHALRGYMQNHGVCP